MESLPKSPVLNFPPDTLNVVRKSWDLDGPGRMNDAIDILDEWIKKQQHFVKKNFRKFKYHLSRFPPYVFAKSSLQKNYFLVDFSNLTYLLKHNVNL